MTFRLELSNPTPVVPAPDDVDDWDTYDLEVAFDDYAPPGLCATIQVGELRLDQRGHFFISLVRALLPFAETLAALPADADEASEVRASIPDLPTGCRAYCLPLVAFPVYWPVFVFAVAGDDVHVYVRRTETLGSVALIPWDVNAGRKAPVVVARGDVIVAVAELLTAYLDDLAGSFPFIAADAMYQSWRQRIETLSRAIRNS